jgi:FkbM family methyltransferase
MTAILQNLKSRLRGTWIHHAVWAYRNPPPKAAWDQNDSQQGFIDYRNSSYDRQTVEVMFRALRQNSNCIDVGAHAGDILRQMFGIAPRGKHYAFEPLPHLAEKLRKEFPHATVHEVALSDRSGESEFLFVENDPGYSGLQRRIYDRPDPKVIKILVRVARLDEIIPRQERIAFIKLDIEGGELHAMKGGVETIRHSQPVIVFEAGRPSTEQYGVKANDVYSLLTETLGYELSTMDRWLNRKAPYTREEFENNWEACLEYYFIATPMRKNRRA